MHGSHSASLLLRTYENIINIFDVQTKFVRLMTDNAAGSSKAFQNLTFQGFEH